MARQPTKQQIEEWRRKAEKWDALDKKMAEFYAEEGEEGYDESVDLTTIGEAAAMAFGYL